MAAFSFPSPVPGALLTSHTVARTMTFQVTSQNSAIVGSQNKTEPTRSFDPT